MCQVSTPGEDDVTFGGSRNSPPRQGNIRLHNLIENRRHSYCVATKLGRSEIISQIAHELKTTAPQAEFLQRDPRSGQYLKLPENKVRERISQGFRDKLTLYKSSKVAKKHKRDSEKSISNEVITSLLTLPEDVATSFEEFRDKFMPYRSGTVAKKHKRDSDQSISNEVISSLPTLPEDVPTSCEENTYHPLRFFEYNTIHPINRSEFNIQLSSMVESQTTQYTTCNLGTDILNNDVEQQLDGNDAFGIENTHSNVMWLDDKCDHDGNAECSQEADEEVDTKTSSLIASMNSFAASELWFTNDCMHLDQTVLEATIPCAESLCLNFLQGKW